MTDRMRAEEAEKREEKQEKIKICSYACLRWQVDLLVLQVNALFYTQKREVLLLSFHEYGFANSIRFMNMSSCCCCCCCFSCGGCSSQLEGNVFFRINIHTNRFYDIWPAKQKWMNEWINEPKTMCTTITNRGYSCDVLITFGLFECMFCGLAINNMH